MGILDGIVDWLATQIMNLLDLLSSSVLGALGCDMSTFKRTPKPCTRSSYGWAWVCSC